MAALDDAPVVPTLAHAHEAARVLAEEGAAQVLLFGSLAEGTARAGSDVDLVAVFDDIDYEERYPRRWALEARCTAAAGAPVEVHVTDWPEWKQRAGNVPSSFEAAIASSAETLYGREPSTGAVRWNKEIGMPDSDLGEAMQRLASVEQSLGEMAAACRPREDETRIVGGRAEVDARLRASRLRGLCADASLVIENSLKTWAALSGISSGRTHSIARLLEQARPLPDALEEALAPLRANTLRPSREDYDDVSTWRIGGTYPSALPQATPERTERIARQITRVAVTVAEITMDRLLSEGADPADADVRACQGRLRAAHRVLASGDVVTGVAPNLATAATRHGRLRRWLSAR